MPFKSFVVGCLHFQGKKKEKEKKTFLFLKAVLMLEELEKTSGPILAQCSALAKAVVAALNKVFKFIRLDSDFKFLQTPF